jgi:Ca2+-transporting ATPase
LDNRLLARSLSQGFSILFVSALVFLFSLSFGQSEDQARALTFTTLIFANIFLILSNRSLTQTIPQTIFKKNPALWWIAGGAMAFLLIINFTPLLSSIFKFSALSFLDFCLALGFGFLSIVWFEIYKLIKRTA